MRKQYIIILLMLLVSFLVLSVLPAFGCPVCNPPCHLLGQCQKCQDGVCVSRCSSNLCQTCINDSCQSTCSGCETCVNGSCESHCDTSLCQICVNGNCQSECKPGCEECVDGECITIVTCDPNCEVCENGECISTCNSNLCLDCINGECQSTCDTSLCQICVGGSCQSECNPDEMCVEGECQCNPDIHAVTYTYDEVGNRLTMTDTCKTTYYTYDYLNRLASVTDPDGNTITYDYDANGNRIQMTLLRQGYGEQSTTYIYTDNNQLETVTTAEGATNYQYDGLGNIEQVDYPNGTYTEYTYHPTRNWLTSVINRQSDGTIISAYYYNDYDNVGNRLSVTEFDGSVVSYGYDNIYQLTSEVRTGANPYSISYTYDNAGNRETMTKNGVNTGYTYNYNNQLLTEVIDSDTTFTYDYDDNDNMVSKSDGADSTLYTWDYENKLTTVHSPLTTVNYEYDGDGNRISKIVDGVKTKYINDVASPLVQVLMETTDEDTVLATYTYGNDLISMNRAGENSYYHYDGLGSVRQLTDDNEAVVAEYTYDAFGNLIASTDTSENTYKFTGEQFDSSSGLLYLRARYYDSNIGRFDSRDPISTAHFPLFTQTLATAIQQFSDQHKYAYAQNNPANYVDPQGLYVTAVCTAVGCSTSEAWCTGNLCNAVTSPGICDMTKGNCITKGYCGTMRNCPQTRYPCQTQLRGCNLTHGICNTLKEEFCSPTRGFGCFTKNEGPNCMYDTQQSRCNTSKIGCNRDCALPQEESLVAFSIENNENKVSISWIPVGYQRGSYILYRSNGNKGKWDKVEEGPIRGDYLHTAVDNMTVKGEVCYKLRLIDEMGNDTDEYEQKLVKINIDQFAHGENDSSPVGFCWGKKSENIRYCNFTANLCRRD